jgi:hypothetical protein
MVNSEGKFQKQHFRKKVSGFWEKALPFAGFTEYTYKCSGKGTFKDCSLRPGIMHPDSTYQKHIESPSMVWKPVDI